MIPLFANSAAAWLLLGVPAVLAVHFLQQRVQRHQTSTLFLIERLAPDSAEGRTWDRLRSSRALWLQLLALLLATWVLAEPRWVRADAAQTVVVVLDASASMDAFQAEARAAAAAEIARVEPLASTTTWVIMTTDGSSPPLYRGNVANDARAALEHWLPELGSHDALPALRLARNLAGSHGQTLFVTDARTKAPADQRTVGVGRPLENVGFAGASVTRMEGRVRWRALVKNHTDAPQQRTWRLAAGGVESPAQLLELSAGGVSEITGEFPQGADRIAVSLATDAFTLDDVLPLVAPQPKTLAITVAGGTEPAAFIRRILGTVPGVKIVNAGTSVDATEIAAWRVAETSASELRDAPHGGIFWAPADRRAQASLLADPVTAASHPLVADLGWQGWIGTGPHGFVAEPGDEVLLWHGGWPIALLRPAPGAPGAEPKRQLLLAFDWESSNAARLPAMVLLIRRLVTAERDVQRVPYAANFDAHAAVSLTSHSREAVWTLRIEPPTMATTADPRRAVRRVEHPAKVRAPARPAFFEVLEAGEVVVHGASHFADPRQGDFRQAATFTVELDDPRRAALARNTAGDPLVPLWLVLMGAAMIGSWWPARRGGIEGRGAAKAERVSAKGGAHMHEVEVER